jgi:site-specific DNA recombinase
MANVVIYTRVSTDEQAAKGTSLPYQKERLEQYCQYSGDNIVKCVTEDYSAKNFADRPEFNKLLAFLKESKGLVNKLIVVRWDRFSRNAPEAYSMISKLAKMGIEVNAVEQPIDHKIPEQKIMLSFYLSIPEVENDRRALNTTNGMRRNMKEGRWVSTAPIGYKNTRDALNKPILIKTEASILIKKAFEFYATSTWQIDVLRKKMNKEGLNIGKNQFWHLLRNPVYCGKIRIKAYRDELEEIVHALHEPIISEELYLEVQNVLDGKKTMKAKQSKTRDELPMRGYLVCSCCGKNLTGSASNGNGGKYFYYHCQPGCKERYKTEIAHKTFENWLGEISFQPETAQLYLAIMEDIFKTNEGDRDSEIKKLDAEYNKKLATMDKAAEKLVNDELDKYAYKRLKENLSKECTEIRLRIDELKRAESGFSEYCRYGISLMSNLPHYYSNATLDGKQKMLGLIFPEKLVFENSTYRTTQPNEILTLLCTSNKDLKENKKGQEVNNNNLSFMVVRRGIEPLLPG